MDGKPLDELSEVTRSRPDIAEEADRGVVVFRDRGDGDRVLMDIPSDIERARLGQG